MHYVYILKNIKDNEKYIGYTSNLANRLKEHERIHPNYKLIYYEAYLHKENANKREIRLKYYGSAWRALKKRIQA